MRYLSMIFLLGIFVYAGESEAFFSMFKCSRFACKNPVKAADCMVESKKDGGGIAEKHPNCYKVILENHEKMCNSEKAIEILKKIGIDNKKECREALKNAKYKEARHQHERSRRR